jgi:hypothetical protein
MFEETKEERRSLFIYEMFAKLLPALHIKFNQNQPHVQFTVLTG